MNKQLYECVAFNGAGLIAMQSRGSNEIEAIRFCKNDLRDKLWKSQTKFYYDLRNFKFIIDIVKGADNDK